MKKRKYAVVGTGFRGMTMFVKPMVKDDLAGSVDLVGVYDSNSARMDKAEEWLGVKLPKFNDFDQMLRQSDADGVIIATRDSTHAEYVVRSLRAGKRVFVEKPLCTTAQQCRDILAVAKETGGTVLTTHNMRYDAACCSIRSLIQQGRAGKIRHVSFEDTLDRSHGADYFRRWHSRRANTGGLQIHKASHHFDILNWWLEAKPVRLFAQGGLKFYGKSSPKNHVRCTGCPHASSCAFYVDLSKIPIYQKLYFEAEHVDGYYRDGCVFSPEIDIEDQLDVAITYDNGVEVSYCLVAHAAYEHMRLAFDGTMGRIEHDTAYSPSQLLATDSKVTERQRLICPGYETMEVPIQRADGDHGGADPMLRSDFFIRDWDAPPTSQMASLDQAIQAILIGVAINKSIKTGQPVDVQALLDRE